MGRAILLLTILAATLIGASGVAWAITYGCPDDGTTCTSNTFPKGVHTSHPNVGMLLWKDSKGYFFECSGTLVSPKHFLTAEHCDPTAYNYSNKVGITFDPIPSLSYDANTQNDYLVGQPQYTGTFEPNPDYTNKQSDPRDIAMVILDSTVQNITPATLPAPDAYKNVSKNQRFTAVGYGDTSGKGSCTNCPRNYAVSTLNTTTASWLKLSQNGSQGNGGTCYGDSGGPNFAWDKTNTQETSTISGITITGDSACKATNVDYRLDTPYAQNFLHVRYGL